MADDQQNYDSIIGRKIDKSYFCLTKYVKIVKVNVKIDRYSTERSDIVFDVVY